MRGNQNWVEEKLDRCLATNKWFDLFPTAMVHNEDASTSDHTPLILEMDSRKMRSYRKFRFENSWTRESTYREVVALSWERARRESILSQIARYAGDLAVWGKDRMRVYTRQLSSCRRKVNNLKASRDPNT